MRLMVLSGGLLQCRSYLVVLVRGVVEDGAGRIEAAQIATGEEARKILAHSKADTTTRQQTAHGFVRDMRQGQSRAWEQATE